jgi:hypothetical protein
VAEWSRTDRGYQARIQDLQLGGCLNSSTVLNFSKVIDDGVADTLTGGSGTDWFLVGALDVLTDHAFNEETN